MSGCDDAPAAAGGIGATVFPDVDRDIMEVLADAPGPLQAKQIMLRMGLPSRLTAM
ncbi:hypothetical protein GCM10010306_103350 [Streptomyces umbrinus]|nr:hypothetical protein GCM10010306_103350 [Streptomyces umbrinus]